MTGIQSDANVSNTHARTNNIAVQMKNATVIPNNPKDTVKTSKDCYGSLSQKSKPLKKSDDYVCSNCGASETPKWHQSALTFEQICNGCKKYEKRHKRSRPIAREILQEVHHMP
jgi:hypothetical protein